MESVVYMDGNDVIEWEVDQTHMIKRYTSESLSFIDTHKHENFYLYLAHNMPHVPIYASEDFLGTSERGLYGDVIQEIDWSVGQILKKLENENLLDNTIIVFSSDNGPWLVMQDQGGSAGELREGKQYTFDGGVKVPTVAMWRGAIKGGQVNTDVISQMDWMPTFAALAGTAIPDSITLDGIDISQLLLEDEDRANDEILLYGINGKLRGFRKGDYKLKLPFEGFDGARWRQGVAAHDTLLYNVVNDPGESNNLLDIEPQRVREMYGSMYDAVSDLGPIHQGHFTHRTPEDHGFYKYLAEKNAANPEYWKIAAN